MTICDTFKRLALQTWDKIEKSRKANYQLKEESITDDIILELKLKHRAELKTIEFNKHDEGKNGADWEWWFKGLNGQFIGFRVQAKIINIHSEEFEHLHYRKDTTSPFQCDKLIKKALTGSNPKIPLYCLYLHTHDNNILNTWRCGTVSPMKELYGCSLISATTVRNLRPKISLADLEKELKPWHCLVCCKGYGDGSFIGNIQAFAQNNFNLTQDELSKLDLNTPDTFTTSSPPKYVLDIIENENNKNIEPPDEDISGIFILSEVK